MIQPIRPGRCHLTTALPTHANYLVIKPSPIQGNGVFTTTGISAGIVLYKLKGDRAYHAYDPWMADQNPNWIGIAYGGWLILSYDDPALFIDHSCSPNVIIDRQQQVVTLKNLNGGEELLLDYSTTEIDLFWKMDCSCGHVECRNTVRSYQFLPVHLQRRYAPYVPVDFTAALKNNHSPQPNLQLIANRTHSFQHRANL